MNDSVAHENCQNCGSKTVEDLNEGNAKDFRKNIKNKKGGILKICSLCYEHCTRRKKISEDIVKKSAVEREPCVIVAGPGSGKTFTFGEVIEKLPQNSLVLVFTLINKLADDLQRDLSQIEGKEVKVNTFHGYCKELLHNKIKIDTLGNDFIYNPALPKILSLDSSVLSEGFSVKDFESAFANMLENKAKDFYLARASYYNAVSHIDSVYYVFSFLRRENNLQRIPEYQMVIADEYQDFNKLEAEFIKILSTKNTTLLAGDDDQALYGFRYAKTDFIRELCNNSNSGYTKCGLPYCSRCTSTIVKAMNYFVDTAIARGHLAGRIEREFESYWPDKYIEQKKYPKVNISTCSTLRTVPKFIEERIQIITSDDGFNGSEHDLQFMIIGPESGFHLNKVKEYLLEELDSDMYELVGPKKKYPVVKLEEAYELLNQDVNSNLGWRMIIYLDPIPNNEGIIKQTKDDDLLVSFLSKDYKEKHLTALAEFNKIENTLKEQDTPENNKIKILFTNFLGSKGLAASHVFVIGLNNGTFPISLQSIENEEVCKFIVALTRAKSSCTLVTNKFYDRQIKRLVNKPSIFLSWLPDDEVASHSYRINNGSLIEESKS